jgi:predicted SAM-dependent methyltransferase
VSKKLNLGCGYRFHPDWVNVDFIKTGENVIAHNLLKGVPFPDNEFDAVYHSHVLEHFTLADGKAFVQECYRVLKPGGIIRTAVPDLEQIARVYIMALDKTANGEPGWEANLEWMRLELFDQMVRMQSGGEMKKFVAKENLENEAFIYERIGDEGKNLRKMMLEKMKNNNPAKTQESISPAKSPVSFFTRLKNRLFRKEAQRYFSNEKFNAIGKFRLGGEIHQWMYDRFSLAKLLRETGFSEIKVCKASESRIENWNTYELDHREGNVFKPDSLFMEGVKK